MAEEPAGFVPDGFIPDEPSQAEGGARVRPGSNSGLAAVAGATAVGGAAKTAKFLAAHPAVLPKIGKIAGMVAGGVAPVAVGGSIGHELGALAASGLTTHGVVLGGELGELAGRGAQKVAGPIARGFQVVAPYAQTLATLGGAQSALGFAQSVEPHRQDIGTLGVGPSVKAGAIPMTPELVAMTVDDAVKSLTDAGWPEARAKSYVTQMRKLMGSK